MITIDLSALLEWIDRGPLFFTLQIFINGGWLVFIALLMMGAWFGWVNYARLKFLSTIKYVLLAIDIPRENEQTPKAVESLFAVLASADNEQPSTFWEKYWEGLVTLSFSFEIVSLEGYTQYLIRLPEHYRDLVEAGLYSQYPDAEIVEVEDYTTAFRANMIPHSIDLWGTDLVLREKDAYPIKTYPFFEHTLSQKLVDPMAATLEVMSRMGPGEQAWLQIVITPIDDDWKDRSKKVVQRLIGARGAESSSKGFFQHLIEMIQSFGVEIFAQLGSGPGDEETNKREEPPTLMQHISPGQRTVVEAVEMKLTKIGFATNMRMMYVASPDVIAKSKGVAGILGALKQFVSQDLNGIKPYKKTATSVHYFFPRYRKLLRKKRILRHFQTRAQSGAELKTTKVPAFVLNTEELATLWHFPSLEVKAPLVKMVGAKKTAPPFSLPERANGAHEQMAHEGDNNLSQTKENFAPKITTNAPPKQMNSHSVSQEETSPSPGEAPTNLPFVD